MRAAWKNLSWTVLDTKPHIITEADKRQSDVTSTQNGDTRCGAKRTTTLPKIEDRIQDNLIPVEQQDNTRKEVVKR